MEEVNTRSVTNNTKPTASKSEVISSTKVLIDAAKSAFGNDNQNIDKAKVADAAADLLDVTSHYGKFEDKSYGKYINKAEDYLHHYNSSHSPASAATAHDGGDKEHGGMANKTHDHEHVKKDEVHHGGESGGGYGEYIKLAHGILKK
ncbi:nodulin-related protein 1-like [Silene latifolia]|uniref:nodulin-related protein 1-like n=1 Tax=Silene latifolia TaxID=37657 RepID=UPI003D781BF2